MLLVLIGLSVSSFLEAFMYPETLPLKYLYQVPNFLVQVTGRTTIGPDGALTTCS
jgi:hypothetical protein